MRFKSLAGKLIALLSVLFFLASCGFVPKQDVRWISFLDYMKEWAQEYTEVNHAIWRGEPGAVAHKADILDTFTSSPKVLEFRAGDTFVVHRTPLFQGYPLPPDDWADDFLFGMINNTDLMLKRRTALTYDGDNKGLISRDGREWYDMSGVSAEKRELAMTFAVREWITFTPRIEQAKRLEVELKWAAAMDPNPSTYWNWDGAQRPESQFGPGMILTHPQKRQITADMRKEVVWFNADTRMNLNFRIEGNLLSGVSTPTSFEVRALRDFWIYVAGPNSVSVSFDGKDWFNMFWDFEFRNEVSSRGIDTRTMESEVALILRYKGRK